MINWDSLPGELRKYCICMNEGPRSKHVGMMKEISKEISNFSAKKCHVCMFTHGVDVCIAPTMVTGRHGNVRTIFGSVVRERYSCINHFDLLMNEAYHNLDTFIDELLIN